MISSKIGEMVLLPGLKTYEILQKKKIKKISILELFLGSIKYSMYRAFTRSYSAIIKYQLFKKSYQVIKYITQLFLFVLFEQIKATQTGSTPGLTAVGAAVVGDIMCWGGRQCAGWEMLCGWESPWMGAAAGRNLKE